MSELARLGVSAGEAAVYSSLAEGVELCCFDGEGEETRLELEEADAGIWRASTELLQPGIRYGFRVHGPFDPARGLWCNPNKLLIDPYAELVEGELIGGPALLAESVDDPSRPSELDSAASVPRAVVVDRSFDWGDDRPLQHSWEETVIYEAHVAGLTRRHPDVPAEQRGSYAALGHPALVEHLVGLGVTALELLPIAESATEPTLAAKGLTNYWGYNPIAHLAPAQRFAAGSPRNASDQLKGAIRELHRAGIEVILDVVYNHTAEGGRGAPSISWKGFDAPAYYRIERGRFIDTTGCGNSVNSAHPMSLRLMVDALRHWVTEYHVDGFRFDLAASLARPQGVFDPKAPLLAILLSDPVLREVKLISESWDVGCADSYALGRFPGPIREWNGKFRDTLRSFWRSDDGSLGDLATRLAGSADLFDSPGRSPSSSINMVTDHDGFTLSDLVTYDEKHNEANLEDNRDGTDRNLSWNCGMEGPSDDPEVQTLRARQRRALLATLVLSCGTPMLLGGDELGRSQLGNNNAYCQDNEISWFDWDRVDLGLVEYTSRLLALRRRFPVLRRRRFPAAADEDARCWFTIDGQPVTPADWQDPSNRCLALHLESAGNTDDLLLMVNGWWEPACFMLPPKLRGSSTRIEIDSFDLDGDQRQVSPDEGLILGPRSLLVLSLRRDQTG